MISGPLQEISLIAITLYTELNCTEGSFLVPLKYIDVTRTTHTSLDVLLEKHFEDYWDVDKDRQWSDPWTGFTRFILLNERPKYMVRGKTDEETSDLKTRQCVARYVQAYV